MQPDVNDAQSLLVFIQIIFFISGGLASIVGLIAGIKHIARKPPIEAEFATKRELADLRMEVDDRFKDMQKSIRDDLHLIGNQITNISDKVEEAISTHYAQAEDKIVRIHNRLDALVNSVAMVDKNVAAIKARCAALHGGQE